MGPSNFQDVGRFHYRFGLPFVDEVTGLGTGPREWDRDLLEFRLKFLKEELLEFIEGMDAGPSDDAEGDHAKMFDALIDLVYVAMGTAHFLGYPWQAGWDAVQRANMAKVRAERDGSNSTRGSAWDVVKPAGWTPPDIDAVLARYGFTTTKEETR